MIWPVWLIQMGGHSAASATVSNESETAASATKRTTRSRFIGGFDAFA